MNLKQSSSPLLSKILSVDQTSVFEVVILAQLLALHLGDCLKEISQIKSSADFCFLLVEKLSILVSFEKLDQNSLLIYQLLLQNSKQIQKKSILEVKLNHEIEKDEQQQQDQQQSFQPIENSLKSKSPSNQASFKSQSPSNKASFQPQSPSNQASFELQSPSNQASFQPQSPSNQVFSKQSEATRKLIISKVCSQFFEKFIIDTFLVSFNTALTFIAMVDSTNRNGWDWLKGMGYSLLAFSGLKFGYWLLRKMILSCCMPGPAGKFSKIIAKHFQESILDQALLRNYEEVLTSPGRKLHEYELAQVESSVGMNKQ